MGRYGVMLGEDGKILDDGVTFRLAEHYLMSTSTGFADLVFGTWNMYFRLNALTAVWITPITSWFNATICGPAARDVLATRNLY